MKKLLIALTLVTAPLAGVATHAGSVYQDQPVKKLTLNKTGTLAAKPICICAFDPDTGKWTCTPTGCWLAEGAQAPTLSPRDVTRTLPEPGRTLPPRR